MAEGGETVVHGFTTVDLVRDETDSFAPGKLLEDDDGGEIELSLGLSLNGRFGVDPNRTQLIRASSMSTQSSPGGDEVKQLGVVEEEPNLIRTCSLPNVMVMDDELRKRKALQSLRRVEAKKRRMDKLRLSKEGREKDQKVDNNSNHVVVYNKKFSDQQGGGGGGGGGGGYVCNNGDRALSVLVQGSELGSQGSGSSGISDLDTNSIQDSLTNDGKAPHGMPDTDRKLPGTTHNIIRSRQCHVVSDHKPPVGPRADSVKDKHTTSVVAEVGTKKKPVDDIGKKMPFVSTVGKGPDGKKIDGLLYRYQKGEEVKIVCVCHGIVFSPAEFVKHAGGVAVENPLKHIVVSSTPCP